ncbi:MAG: tautomerase [Actinomycetota bacterium]
MPIATVRVPSDSFDDDLRRAIVNDLTSAIADAEQIPTEPEIQGQIVILWDEIDAPHVHVNGAEVAEFGVPVFVDIQPPAGALEQARMDAFVEAVDRSFRDHPPADGRPVFTSVIVSDVGDGRWGIDGQVRHLGDFARAAGYRHLQHLVS